jgi:biopolymer transport protein ExbD
MRRTRSSGERHDLDISPLIDMVFILLIFFMVTTTFVKDMAVDIERPDAASGKPASTKAVRVAIDPRGEIFVDGTSVRPWMIQGHVKDALRAGATGEVLIVTDRRVSSERLIEVVDQCRLAGAKDIAVATEREAG